MTTALITREGFNALKKELEFIWKTERPEITAKVSWAASLGDRSENADYKENKRKLRQIDKKIRYISKRLEALKIVDYSPQQEGRVFFGARVVLENEEGKTLSVRITGYDEIFARSDYISIDSPMARALLKKEVDDEAVVMTPEGEKVWCINSITYDKKNNS